MKDTRIAYGANCTWWGSIHEVGKADGYGALRLPCCPICKGVLFEVPTEKDWWTAVDKHEAKGNPGYRKMVEWARGRCFSDAEHMRLRYQSHDIGRGV